MRYWIDMALNWKKCGAVIAIAMIAGGTMVQAADEKPEDERKRIEAELSRLRAARDAAEAARWANFVRSIPYDLEITDREKLQEDLRVTNNALRSLRGNLDYIERIDMAPLQAKKEKNGSLSDAEMKQLAGFANERDALRVAISTIEKEYKAMQAAHENAQRLTERRTVYNSAVATRAADQATLNGGRIDNERRRELEADIARWNGYIRDLPQEIARIRAEQDRLEQAVKDIQAEGDKKRRAEMERQLGKTISYYAIYDPTTDQLVGIWQVIGGGPNAPIRTISIEQGNRNPLINPVTGQPRAGLTPIEITRMQTPRVGASPKQAFTLTPRGMAELARVKLQTLGNPITPPILQPAMPNPVISQPSILAIPPTLTAPAALPLFTTPTFVPAITKP